MSPHPFRYVPVEDLPFFIREKVEYATTHVLYRTWTKIIPEKIEYYVFVERPRKPIFGTWGYGYIYVANTVVDASPIFAELVAYHEYIEMEHDHRVACEKELQLARELGIAKEYVTWFRQFCPQRWEDPDFLSNLHETPGENQTSVERGAG